jgi:hypothetical protein
VAFEPAGVNVWHEEQPEELNSALPAATSPPDELVVVADVVVVGVDVDPTVSVTVLGGLPSDV